MKCFACGCSGGALPLVKLRVENRRLLCTERMVCIECWRELEKGGAMRRDGSRFVLVVTAEMMVVRRRALRERRREAREAKTQVEG